VETGKPDYPFCLCWANHSWYAKTWDPNTPDKLLIEQTYPGVEDYTAHFYEMLPAFKDNRYMKVDGKLIFGVFAALDIPDFKLFKDTWNKLANDNGLEGFYFFGFTFNYNDIDKISSIGYDTCLYDGVRFRIEKPSITQKILKKCLHLPTITEYNEYTSHYLNVMQNVKQNIHLCINPNFDHSPRSAYRGVILHNSTPNKWFNFCKKAIETTTNKFEGDYNILFIKAWNEWGEGNYLEPDSKFGKEYIIATAEALSSHKN